jgi:hypothetical protein
VADVYQKLLGGAGAAVFLGGFLFFKGVGG